MRARERWIIFSVKIPPVTRALIEQRALRSGQTQSEVCRQALDRFFAGEAESRVEEVEAAKSMERKRKETLRLVTPKDGHATAMQAISAWEAIEVERREFEEHGILSSRDFDAWIQMLEENKAAIEPDNPQRERMAEKFDMFIDRLRKEKAELYNS